MLKRTLPAVLLMILAVPSLASAQDPQDPAPPVRNYLRPGDVIRLNIWREPEMSRDVQVDEAGMAVFPRLGTMSVTGETPESLEAKLLLGYRRFLRNPSMDIIVLRRVRITGAVQTPGLYPVDPTISIADALAMAGGATARGNQKEIRILRNGEELRTVVTEGTVIAESLIQSGDVIFVPERNWVSRNAGVVAASIGAIASLTIALFIR